MSDTISMEALARFAILPGAGELVEAFSAIPPGPMRDAVIHLAKTTAATYQGHGGAVIPDPIGQIGGRSEKAPALRIGRTPPMDSPQAQAVKLRIETELSTKEIAQRTGLSPQQVSQAVYEARKAGAPIPKRAKAPMDGSGSSTAKTWHTSFATLTGQGQAQVTKAAAQRGITPQAYLDRRQLALKMAQEGASYDRILQATGETDSKIVSAWLSAARGAGHKVPYVTFLRDVSQPTETPQETPEAVREPPPAPTATEAPPPPAEAPWARVFPQAKDMHQGAAVAIHKAAQRRGMTVKAYEDMRERIVILRRGGMTPSQISADTGQGKQFVKDTLEAAEKRGAVFPALASEDGGFSFEPPQVRERSAG